MGVTNPAMGTRVDEIATGIYRISTPAREAPGGFSFNQYLIVDDQPLLFHTGSRRLLPLVQLRWFDTPHLPHAWDCGYLSEEHTRTLLCGDLFTQGGSDNPPLVTGDILGPSEAFRRVMDYYSHTKHARALLDRLASTGPQTLACMHGSAWQGDGARLLGELAVSLES